MARSYWLIKSEPFKYPWEQLVADGSTYWDGVRNYEARNNLGEMKLGDLCLYYHSNEGKQVVGVARVCGESFPTRRRTIPSGWSWTSSRSFRSRGSSASRRSRPIRRYGTSSWFAGLASRWCRSIARSSTTS